MNIVKKIISITSLTALIASLSLNAQTPQGEVNEQGQLVLPGMDPIDPPAGTVDEQGNLVLPSGTINKPEATINADGSLTTPDGTFQVPAVPLTAFLDLYELAPGVYFQAYIGTIWPAEGTNWIFMNLFSALGGGSGGWSWVSTSSGNNEAFWIYNTHFDDWFYIFAGEGGLGDILAIEGEGNFQSGYLFSADAQSWFFYFEDAAGGYFNYGGGEDWILTLSK